MLCIRFDEVSVGMRCPGGDVDVGCGHRWVPDVTVNDDEFGSCTCEQVVQGTVTTTTTISHVHDNRELEGTCVLPHITHDVVVFVVDDVLLDGLCVAMQRLLHHLFDHWLNVTTKIIMKYGNVGGGERMRGPK